MATFGTNTISSKYFKMRYGSGPSTLAGYDWQVSEDEGAMLDATDSESNGFGSNDIGVQQMTVSCKGFFTQTSAPFAALVQGTLLTNIKLYPHGIINSGAPTNGYWYAASAMIVGNVTTGQVKGRTEYSFTIKSQGSYSWVPA